MRLHGSSSIFSALLVASFGLASNQAKATDYPLYCRGGGNGVVEVLNNQGLGINYNGHAQADYFFYFIAGTRAYGGINSMTPGECQWADRAFRSNEPALLWQSITNDYNYVTFTAQGNGAYFYSSGAPWVVNWSDSKAVIKFMVHNDEYTDGGASMVIDSFSVLSQ